MALKKFATIVKFIFQFLCLIALIYQLIELTNNYLNFDFEIKLDITEEKKYDLPSITICIKSNINSNKIDESSVKEVNETLNSYFYEYKNLTEILDCYVFSDKYNNKLIIKKCKLYGKVLEYISVRDELLKCFTYFNKIHLNSKSTNDTISKISLIEFKFSPQIFQKYIHSNIIYLSINPSNSVFSSTSLYEFNFTKNFNYNYEIIFSKSNVKSFERPHKTDCYSLRILLSYKFGRRKHFFIYIAVKIKVKSLFWNTL